MSEPKYKVPDGMLEAARMVHRGPAIFTVSPTTVREIVEAALRWLAENPIVPTEQQERALDDAWMRSKRDTLDMAHKFAHASAFGAVEWQRRMFLAPEPEVLKVPEKIKDLLLTVEDCMYGSAQTLENEIRGKIIEAYRRGQQSK